MNEGNDRIGPRQGKWDECVTHLRTDGVHSVIRQPGGNVWIDNLRLWPSGAVKRATGERREDFRALRMVSSGARSCAYRDRHEPAQLLSAPAL